MVPPRSCLTRCSTQYPAGLHLHITFSRAVRSYNTGGFHCEIQIRSYFRQRTLNPSCTSILFKYMHSFPVLVFPPCQRMVGCFPVQRLSSSGLFRGRSPSLPVGLYHEQLLMIRAFLSHQFIMQDLVMMRLHALSCKMVLLSKKSFLCSRSLRMNLQINSFCASKPPSK